jgi:branched-chain amino acid aminotransferase
LEPKIKHRSRLYLQMANIEAANIKGKNNWPLLLDEDGFIAEGSGDNFFIIKNEILYTPEGRNILRGISRDYIFEICRKHNIECLEKNIEIYDVLDADEAFMTGTPFCMLPVCRINGCPIGIGKTGLLTLTLLRWWGESVGVDIAGQIKGWNSDNNDSMTPYQFKR